MSLLSRKIAFPNIPRLEPFEADNYYQDCINGADGIAVYKAKNNDSFRNVIVDKYYWVNAEKKHIPFFTDEIEILNGVPVTTPTTGSPIVALDTTTGLLYGWNGTTWVLQGSAGDTSIYLNDGVLTGNRNLDGANFNLTFDNLGVFSIEAATINLVNLPSNNLTETNFLVRNSLNGKLEIRDISTVTSIDTNFANTNLTLTGNRSHTLGINNLSFTGTGLSGSNFSVNIDNIDLNDGVRTKIRTKLNIQTPPASNLLSSTVLVRNSGTGDVEEMPISVLPSGQTGIQYQDEGINLGSIGTVNTVNFTGLGVSVVRTGNLLTVDVSGGGGGLSYTDEEAQDTVFGVLENTGSNTLDYVYNDPFNEFSIEVRTQMSITSTNAGIKLVNDVTTPTEQYHYGTAYSTGTKGWIRNFIQRDALDNVWTPDLSNPTFGIGSQENIIIGKAAAANIITAQRNTIIGNGSNVNALTTNWYNTIIGYANQIIGNPYGNSILGCFNGKVIGGGGFNTLIGYNNLFSVAGNNANAQSNTITGYGNAIEVTGNSNVITGYENLSIASSASDNVIIGNKNGQNITTGSDNIFIGNTVTGLPTGNSQLVIGKGFTGGGTGTWIDPDYLLTGTTTNVLFYDSTTGNVTWGAASSGGGPDTSIYLNDGTLGSSRILTGGTNSLLFTDVLWFNNQGVGLETTSFGELAEAVGVGNVSIGKNSKAIDDNITSIGFQAGFNTLGSNDSVFIGNNAGNNINNNTGFSERNVLIGSNTGLDAFLTSPNFSRNTFIGYNAGITPQGAINDSVFIGCDAGANSASSGCVYIGRAAGLNSVYTFSIGIGSGAINTDNNQLSLKFDTYITNFKSNNLTTHRNYSYPNSDGVISLFNRIIELKNANFTVGNVFQTDYVYFVSGTTTATLATAISNKNEYKIKNVGANTVTIAAIGGQFIDGSASITISSNTALTILSDNTNWNVF